MLNIKRKFVSIILWLLVFILSTGCTSVTTMTNITLPAATILDTTSLSQNIQAQDETSSTESIAFN